MKQRKQRKNKLVQFNHSMLRTLRESKNYNQLKMAQILGLDERYIRLLESGNRTPSLNVLTHYISHFRVEDINLFFIIKDYQ